jgi:hypothetical protein
MFCALRLQEQSPESMKLDDSALEDLEQRLLLVVEIFVALPTFQGFFLVGLKSDMALRRAKVCGRNATLTSGSM